MKTIRPFKPAVSIVIGSLNRRSFIEPTLDSVRAELSPEDREIIVVDGGSDDGTVDWLLSQKDVITIVQHNRGTWNGEEIVRRSWGYFMNLGFRAASAPAICMLSDDCLVVPGAIRNSLPLLSVPDVGAIAFYWRNWPEQRKYWVGKTFGNRLFVNHGLFRAKALSEIGYADTETFAFYHGDGDLAERLSEAGWRCVDCPRSFVEHHSHANALQRAENLRIASEDWESYSNRWGHLGNPPEPWETVAFRDRAKTAEAYWGPRPKRLRLGDAARRAVVALRHRGGFPGSTRNRRGDG